MFSDIAMHWASGCIVALAQRKIVSGYPTGTFRPMATVTRAEFAALMPKVFPELTELRGAQSFPDVPAEYWAHDGVSWAAERGLFSGYDNGTFRPRNTLTRVNALVVLMIGLSATRGVAVDVPAVPDMSVAEEADGERVEKAAGKLSGDTDLKRVRRQFSDAAQVPGYAIASIANALTSGLLETTREQRPFFPNQSVTRGEVAALLCRALEIPASELAVEFSALTAAADSQQVFERMLQAEAGFDESKLAFLDIGASKSPYRKDINQFALWLQQPRDVAAPLDRSKQESEAKASDTATYPSTGELFFVNETGLEFLPKDILSGCVCLSTTTAAGGLSSRWLGRDALRERQLWSATKFIPLLNVVTRANAAQPKLDIAQCRVRTASSTGRFGGYPFQDLADGIMTYDNRIATSNSLAVMFKNFQTPERLEKWTQQMTGNSALSFQGRYGEVPFIQYPELYSLKDKSVMLKSSRVAHRGENLLSTYDLTRLLSMTGWHWQLPARSRIPNLQTPSLVSLIKSLAMDTARYVDVALETLGLTEFVRSPVVLSKSGFGRSDERDRTELTYCALAQFSLPRSISGTAAPDPTAAYQRHSLCFTLIAAQNVGDANKEARYVDALMASAVTEIIRRAVLSRL